MYQMSKANNSKNWIKGHVKDPFVIQAQKDGYRSRAAYKLTEIDKNEIYKMRLENKTSFKELSLKFKCSVSHIHKTLTRIAKPA